ncbi:MAG: CheR family methyltransferase [Bdellovibrionota bacterium]
MAKLQKDEGGFIKLAEILKSNAGINMVLNDKNLTLMASRLNSVLKQHQLPGYKEYIKLIESGDPKYFTEFIVSLTTNTTQFFREPTHFSFLETKLPEILAQKKQQKNNNLRVWCSASSTGQEVYTLLMVLDNYLQNLSGCSIKFLATDIDHEVLERASDAIYRESEIGGIPKEYLKKYFHSSEDEKGIKFQLKSNYRDMIRFATFNLLTESYPFQYPFDIIFCRNVLIYFDRATCEAVIEKLAKSLSVGGILFLGHSETGMMKTKLLKTISNGVYIKV